MKGLLSTYEYYVRVSKSESTNRVLISVESLRTERIIV